VLGAQRRGARVTLLVAISSLQFNLAAPGFASHSGVSRTAEESMFPTLPDSIIRSPLR
jgi:hypothetical protein